MKSWRAGTEDPRVFDAVVVLLCTWFTLGAYVDAWAHVIANGPSFFLGPMGQAAINASWFALTGWLILGFVRGLTAGRLWAHALPDGYLGSLVASLIFGAAVIVDIYWTSLFSDAKGLNVLFSPPHIVEIAAASVMVSGPLRAAARRGETEAGITTLISAALLLSVLTFATQFAHPLIDMWAAGGSRAPEKVTSWVAENLGEASILAQGALLVAAALLLNNGFKLRPGSLALVFTINGALVVITKQHLELLPVMVLTGVASDFWLWYHSRRAGRPAASLGALVAAGFAALYFLAVVITGGIAWGISLTTGTVIAAGLLGWLMGRLLPVGLPAAMIAPAIPITTAETREVRWTRDPESSVRPQLVKAALDDLGSPEGLGLNPLSKLAAVSQGGSAAADLRAALIDVIGELAASPAPRDAEAGKLLLDYYVKRVGSHEVIMERLHLSRPTFYRRLQRGFALVAERLDELNEFAERVPVES